MSNTLGGHVVNIRQNILNRIEYQRGDRFTAYAIGAKLGVMGKDIHTVLHGMIERRELEHDGFTANGFKLYKKCAGNELLRRAWVKWHPPSLAGPVEWIYHRSPHNDL